MISFSILKYNSYDFFLSLVCQNFIKLRFIFIRYYRLQLIILQKNYLFRHIFFMTHIFLKIIYKQINKLFVCSPFLKIFVRYKIFRNLPIDDDKFLLISWNKAVVCDMNKTLHNATFKNFINQSVLNIWISSCCLCLI